MRASSPGGTGGGSPLRRVLLARQDCVDAAQALLERIGGAMRSEDAATTTTTTTTTTDDDDDYIGDLDDAGLTINSSTFATTANAYAVTSDAQAALFFCRDRQHRPAGACLPATVLAHILAFTDPATKLLILEYVPELRDLVFLHSVWRRDLIDLSFLTYDSAVYRRSVLRHGMKLLMRMGKYLRHLRLTVTNDLFYPASRLNHALLRCLLAYCPSVLSLQLVVKWSEDAGQSGGRLDPETASLLQLLDGLFDRCRGQISVNCAHSSLAVTCAVAGRLLLSDLAHRCLSMQCVPFFKPHNPVEAARLPRLTLDVATQLTSLRHLTVSYLWNHAHEKALLWLANHGRLVSLTVDTGFMSRYHHQHQQPLEAGFAWRDRFWRELILAAPGLELSFILYGEPSTLWLSDLDSLTFRPLIRSLYVQTQNAEQELPLLLKCAGFNLEYLAVHAVGPMEERGWSVDLTRLLLRQAPRLRGFAYEGGRVREQELLAIAKHYGSQLRCLHVRLDELLDIQLQMLREQQQQQQQQHLQQQQVLSQQQQQHYHYQFPPSQGYQAAYGLVKDVLYEYLRVEWNALAPAAHLPPMRRLVLDDFFNPLRPAACQFYQLASRDLLD